MLKNVIGQSLEMIRNRSLPDGGFGLRANGSFRPDATAWAVLALVSADTGKNLSKDAGARLAKNQLQDGRVSLNVHCPTAYWPTPLAILAWQQLSLYEREKDIAINFLLSSTGRHYQRKKDAVTKHDTAIKGWPWSEDTYSWVIPTSHSMLALKTTQFFSHERVREGGRVLVDRQLPSGGWNYGNVMVFGKELKPTPETTGHALCALSGLVEEKTIQQSIRYLNKQIKELRTPLSLAWAAFGLSAWGVPLDNFQDQVLESLSLQRRYGQYDTVLLAQLLLAYFTKGDLNSFLH